jgi:SOS response regulatory protein OraA/RecX
VVRPTFGRTQDGESATAETRIDRAAERRRSHAAVDDPALVMEAAAGFLSARPRSVAETRRRLRHLGYRHELVESVVGRLVETGYLDDGAFARAWVESRDRARPRGAAALRRELALKGVDRPTIDRVLEERDAGGGHRSATASLRRNALLATDAVDPDATADTDDRVQPSAEEDAARRVLERKLPALMRERDERRRWQKAYALLARSGFDPDTCTATVRSVFHPTES